MIWFFVFIIALLFLSELVRLWRISEGQKNRLPEFRVVKYWRDDIARYYYRLEENCVYNYYVETDYIGNIKWAKKTAAHYKCKIVPEEDDV